MTNSNDEGRRKPECSNDEYQFRALSFNVSPARTIRHFLIVNLSPENKVAGVLTPLFALRSEKGLGIGDVATLREFIVWAREIGFRVVQLLPINEVGRDNSPSISIGQGARRQNRISKMTSSRSSGDRTGGSRFMTGRRCARRISPGGDSGCAA